MISEGVIAGLIVMVCWGTSDFILSIPIRKIGTLKSILFRNFTTILFITPLAIFHFNTGQMSISLFNFSIIFTSSLIFILAYYFLMRGFEIGKVSLVSPIAGAYSIITVFLALAFLGESLSGIKLMAIFLMLLGVFFTSSNITEIKNIRSQKGLKEALLAMLGFGISFFVLGIISKQMDSLSIFIYASLSQAILFIALSLLKRGRIEKEDFNFKIIMIFIIHTIIVNTGWFAYVYGVGKDAVSIVTPLSSLLPGVTVILALIFYKEKLVANQKLGIVGILIGVFLISL
jgi:drug/metabolite transporter (DMT)-like permease